MTTIRVDNVKQTLWDLADFDRKMYQQFLKETKSILGPAVRAVQAAITGQAFPSGTRRKWHGRRGLIFPIYAVELQKSVKPKVNKGKRSDTTFYIESRSPAWGVWEFASNANSLGRAFTQYGGNPARTMWPTVNKNIDGVVSELMTAIEQVEKIISQKVA